MKTLYIVATPIGNLQDVTSRALLTLNEVGAVLCEDTRQTKKLFDKYKITTKTLIPFNEFNEGVVIFEALKLLETVDVALVSDAGTPLISDPGYRLVFEAKKHNIKVVPIPGASAVIAALSASGLPTDKFTFLGFLPKTKSKAIKNLKSAQDLDTTVILYEAPYRVVKTLELIKEVFGDINVTVARELTKIHEEIFAGTIQNLLSKYKKTKPKGEFVLLFATKILN